MFLIRSQLDRSPAVFRTVQDAQTGQTCHLNAAQAAAQAAGRCQGCRCMWVGDAPRPVAPVIRPITRPIETMTPAATPTVITVQATPTSNSGSAASSPATVPVSSPVAALPATVTAAAADATSSLSSLFGSVHDLLFGAPWVGSIPNWMLLAGAGLAVAAANGGHRR